LDPVRGGGTGGSEKAGFRFGGSGSTCYGSPWSPTPEKLDGR
jgi:hypothetical protein